MEKRIKTSKKLQVNDIEKTEHQLIVKGQGVISLKLVADKNHPFLIKISQPEENNANQNCELIYSALIFSIGNNGIELKGLKGDNPTTLDEKKKIGYDIEDECRYWLSLDTKNNLLRYGKGEARVGTMLFEYDLNKILHQAEWLKKVKKINTGRSVFSVIYRDPIVNEPPLFVVPTEKIIIEDIARGTKTTPGNLTKENQVLYDNVAGPLFSLDTDDFPNFTDAIEESIKNKEGWCYKKLLEKSTEFGGDNPKETYLRITLGLSGGNSPGIPYVIEIWPPGHYSPIHNHGNSNAVIKVLHGEITVNLFDMLSGHHMLPFNVAKFTKGDVTYITPDVNQVHQLRNTNVIGPTCITIQCYTYSDQDESHYEFFDYLNEDGKIEHFTPNSDMDFLSFKQEMKKEWNIYNQHKK